jgi:hypothetical protein
MGKSYQCKFFADETKAGEWLNELTTEENMDADSIKIEGFSATPSTEDYDSGVWVLVSYKYN